MAPSATAIQDEFDAAPLYMKNNSLPTKNVVVTVTDLGQHGLNKSKPLIGAALTQRIQSIDPDTCDAGEEDSFFVADLGEVYRQHLRWKRNLPRVKPHYAVKCNPDPKVIHLLAALGAGFDCASKTEIDQVLADGVEPDRIIFAQPCKTKSYIRHAARQGVKQMTFDNLDELHKIKHIFPEAELYLRIAADDSQSLVQLSMKYGAALESVPGLLELAKQLDLNVVGVAFHVGSGAADPNAFYNAVRDARWVFDQASALGFTFHTLDVGGGFVPESFEEKAAVLSGALEKFMPPQIRIIAEPGRYYVQNAFTIACHVIARRTVIDPKTAIASHMIYLNDGVYGNFSGIPFDHQHPQPRLLRVGRNLMYDVDTPETGVEYSLWGPTCDGIDQITTSCFFPQTIDVGDWLYFDYHGAYNGCSATRFNGFSDKHDIVYVNSEAGATALLGV